MQMLREKSSWEKVPHRVTNMDYLLDDDGRLIAIRKFDSEDWQKFTRPLNFSKRWRSFTKLNEPMPTEFVTPYTPDPWTNVSYNSLEAYM